MSACDVPRSPQPLGHRKSELLVSSLAVVHQQSERGDQHSLAGSFRLFLKDLNFSSGRVSLVRPHLRHDPTWPETW